MKIPRIVVAGVASGTGKTLVASAIAHGLHSRGYTVQPFKVGPDYIDPGYLSLAAGREARNLDSWLMGQARLLESFARAASTADFVIVEGVMGYYDGASGKTNRASTYETACLLGAPVILVVDASRTARSIAATVVGFLRYQKNSRIIGVVLNRVGSQRHADFCTDSLTQAGIRIFGSIPRDESYVLESRHLGLVPPIESTAGRNSAMRAIKGVSDHIDIDAVAHVARAAPALCTMRKQSRTRARKASVCVALDASFNFYYRDNLEALEQNGAELKFFSPVCDAHLPECDGLYIGGGFPEVLAGPLEQNSGLRREVKKHATIDRRAVYAECGGLMYLTRAIESAKKRHAMAGVIDAKTTMNKKMVLNYTQGRTTRDCLALARAERICGHEFHYSSLANIGADTSFAYVLECGEGIDGRHDGVVQDAVLASYGHLYFGASKIARNIVNGVRSAARR